MPNYRLTLAYDGTDFIGSQAQASGRTVQGEVDRVLGELAAGSSRSIFAGRTDRGVHAAGQVVAVWVPSWNRSASDLHRAFDARLPHDVSVVDAASCEPTFNPRFDACWREYRYRIIPAARNPLLRRYAWTPRADVDRDAIAGAARRLEGRHDFASFASGGEGVPWSPRQRQPHGTIRTVWRCECRAVSFPSMLGSEIEAGHEIRIAADGFLPRMVRNIVGALVEIGQGRQAEQWIEDLLDAKDRRSGSPCAPPRGLTLWRVGFAGDDLEDWTESSPGRGNA